MKRLVLSSAFAVALVLPSAAQVLPFNAAGVTMGHHHIMVPDVAAQKKIWVDVLGGQLSGNAPLEFVKFPGTFLILSTGKGTLGTFGSSLDHLAFNVKDYKGTRSKLVAAGCKIIEDDTKDGTSTRFTAELPDGIRVEFFNSPTLATPIAHRAIGFLSTNPTAEREWWEKYLGATTVKEGDQMVTSIPGARLFFHESASPMAKTQGRALDHTGIGVKNVNEFCEQLAAKGVMCEKAMGGAIAMVTDPAGVRIEINQGLENR